MRLYITLMAALFAAGCGDKNEDTSAEDVTEETEETEEETGEETEETEESEESEETGEE